jgi:hypothetical protein
MGGGAEPMRRVADGSVTGGSTGPAGGRRLQNGAWRRVAAARWVNFFTWIQVWSSGVTAWEGKRAQLV